MFCFARIPLNYPQISITNARLLVNDAGDDGFRSIFFSEQMPERVTDYRHLVTAERIACFDGVLINGGDLVKKYALPGVDALLDTALGSDNPALITYFHGQFAAMTYNRLSGSGSFYTNQTNSSRVYYYHVRDVFICSTSLRLIVSLMKLWNLPVSVDQIAARMVLYYGYTLENLTTISGIRLLKAGQVLKLDNGKSVLESYHQFTNTPEHKDMASVLPILDELFKEAVRQEYSWDCGRNWKHLAFLSGGLDSRMSLYTAHNLGFKDINCLNFSQTGHLDQIIARDITKSLGLPLLFYPLDGGGCLENLGQAMQYNEGQIIFHGAAHLFQAINHIDSTRYGVFHSGQVGDLILGSFLGDQKHEEPGIRSIGLTRHTDPELETAVREIAAGYPNQELFALYNRGFNAASNGDLASAQVNHSISPFLYPRFAQYCLNISPELRFNNRLYKQWYNVYQHQAGRMREAKTGAPVTAGKYTRKALRIVTGIRRRISSHGSGSYTSMNPFDYWYRQNPSLRSSLDSQFASAAVPEGALDKSLQSGLAGMFASGSVSDRINAYTLACGLAHFLLDDPQTLSKYIDNNSRKE